MKSQIATPEEKSTTESVGSPVLHEMKRKFSQILDDESSDGSDNETLRTKLERLAMENSTDDSDFNVSNIKRLIFKKFKIECNVYLNVSFSLKQKFVIKELLLKKMLSVRIFLKKFCDSTIFPDCRLFDGVKHREQRERRGQGDII